jgi:Serine carboxypeptidase S28
MKVPALLCALAALGGANPASSQSREKRAASSAYAAHAIDQPVCVLTSHSSNPSDNVQIDHFQNSSRYKPHTKDTFKQRYFFDSSYYKPGGPVFLYIGGETSGESRFSNLQTGSKCALMIIMS